MNDQEQMSPRRRLQILQAIPDYDRTEAEWEELAELEISLSPSNRAGGPEPSSNNPSAANRKRSNNKPVNKLASPQRKPPRKPRPDGRPDTRPDRPAEPRPEPVVVAEPVQAAEGAAPANTETGDKPTGGPKRGFRRTPRRRSSGKPSSGAGEGGDAPSSDSGE